MFSLGNGRYKIILSYVTLNPNIREVIAFTFFKYFEIVLLFALVLIYILHLWNFWPMVLHLVSFGTNIQ